MKKFNLLSSWTKVLISMLVAALVVPFPIDLVKKNTDSKNLNCNINKTSSDKISKLLWQYGISSAAFAETDVVLGGEPIILNLDNSNEFTTNIANGMHFDFNGDGFAERMSWAANGCGVLAADFNRNGIIDNGDEIVKDENFASFDSNNDGIINQNDKDYNILRILRNNGKISTLGEENIAYIVTKTEKDDYTDNAGNYRFGSGTFYKADGNSHRFEEYYLVSDTKDTVELNKLAETKEVKRLPDIKNQGTIHSLHQAMLNDKTLLSLVKNFINENNDVKRTELVGKIIYQWTNSSNHNDVADSILGIRDLNNNEEVMLSNNNPPKEQLYLQFENYVYAELMSQSHSKKLISLLKLKDGRYDLTALVKYLDKQMNNNPDEAKQQVLQMARVLKGLGIDKQSNFFDPKNDDCFYTKFISYDRNLKWEVDTIGKIALDTKNPKIGYHGAYPERGLELSGTDIDDTYNAMLDKVSKKFAYIHTYFGDDVVYGDNSKQVIYGCHGDDMIDGGNADDALYGVYDNDIIFARGGNDRIYAGPGNDMIIAGEGNDEIYTNHYDEKGSIIEFNQILGKDVLSSGKNIVNAGKGNDIITSIYGEDTYIFNLGDGGDTIYKTGGEGTIYFGKGIKWNDVSFTKANNDMIISLNNSSDFIVVKDWFDSKKNIQPFTNTRISTFEFADGSKHYEDEINI